MAKNQNEKKSLNRFTILIILLTIVALILVSGTYARYTSTATGEDTAIVASWDIELNDEKLTVVDPDRSFGLFTTINDTKLDAGGDIVDETDVTDNMIAPGTQGAFTFTIENLSDVTAEYTLSAVVTGQPVPIVYSLDNTAAIGDWTSDLSTLEFFDAADATANDIAIGGNEVITVYWQWPFADDGSADTTDTAIGVAAATAEAAGTPLEVTVETSITVTQVD